MSYMEDYDETSAQSILAFAKKMIGKRLRELIEPEQLNDLEKKLDGYANRRKGHFGDLVEEYVFHKTIDNLSQPDFPLAGVELKTTPLKKHATKKYVAKERLVFSMIDYMRIIDEKWESSSFLKKNKLLLLMFYLYDSESSKLDYEFKIVRLLDLLHNIDDRDIVQIEADWTHIVTKIKRGEAHLLSEGDTVYLGAVTKAANSKVRREQPCSKEPAKPRAFSLKQSYLNQIIQDSLPGSKDALESLFKSSDRPQPIEELISARCSKFYGRTEGEIANELGVTYEKRPKNFRRLIVNRMLKIGSSKVKEFEKANITLKVIALERSGRLTESISFPTFKYEELVKTSWEESDLYMQLTTKKFLFMVFRKIDENESVFEKFQFWNFPMKDIDKAQLVWEETVKRIKEHKADALPRISESSVVHVRPHARNKADVYATGYGTFEVKKCFWLNAKYIEEQLEN